MTENTLKQRLRELSKDNFSTIEKDEQELLIPFMLQHIGTTDPVLRDNLIYTALCNWIIERKFMDDKKLEELTNILTGNAYLCYGIGEMGTDTVFKRSFSVLQLSSTLYANYEKPYLSREKLLWLKDTMLSYLREEKDLRGFVPGKGWAHAVAHAADALNNLSESKDMNENDLLDILGGIKDVFCKSPVGFSYGEDERMAQASLAAINRGVVSDENLIEWVHSFNTREMPKLEINHSIIRRYNVRNFLTSLYFFLVWEDSAPLVAQAIKKILKKNNIYMDD